MICKISYAIFKMISSVQIRAARAFLRWSAAELAQFSGVGVATIRRLELADGVPSSNARTLDALQKTLEAAGIEFIGTPEDAPGVRLKTISDSKSTKFKS
jgi:transcriptional regulator with XRE-family HTH domain